MGSQNTADGLGPGGSEFTENQRETMMTGRLLRRGRYPGPWKCMGRELKTQGCLFQAKEQNRPTENLEVKGSIRHLRNSRSGQEASAELAQGRARAGGHEIETGTHAGGDRIRQYVSWKEGPSAGESRWEAP